MTAPSPGAAGPRPLDGRRALVTGSSRNLGAEIARNRPVALLDNDYLNQRLVGGMG